MAAQKRVSRVGFLRSQNGQTKNPREPAFTHENRFAGIFLFCGIGGPRRVSIGVTFRAHQRQPSARGTRSVSFGGIDLGENHALAVGRLDDEAAVRRGDERLTGERDTPFRADPVAHRDEALAVERLDANLPLEEDEEERDQAADKLKMTG